MNEKTEQLVRELAEKFGTTVDHLWEVLLRQAFVSAITNTILFVVSGVLLGVALLLIIKRTKKGLGYDAELIIIAALTVGVLSSAWLLGLMVSLPEIAAGFFNPEYWALKQLLK